MTNKSTRRSSRKRMEWREQADKETEKRKCKTEEKILHSTWELMKEDKLKGKGEEEAEKEGEKKVDAVALEDEENK